MPETTLEPWVEPFIGSLERLVVANQPDAATLAKLRRGFTEKRGERDLWVYSQLGPASPKHEECALLVASLFALWHQGGRATARPPAESFGGSYGRLRTLTGSESVEKRFAVLIDSHAEDLPDRLRQAVTLLRAKDIAVNWRNLLRDLIQWSTFDRTVQHRWARHFWGTIGSFE
jgi:CRISPR type I-E-associated protein CasB/Cse2